jgi:hypothetical protein
MRIPVAIVLASLLFAAAAAPGEAAMGLSAERGGLGLRQPSAAADPVASWALANDFALADPAARGGPVAYGGQRDRIRLGTMATESFGGLAWSLSDRVTGSLELGTMESTVSAPRRYSLTGQLQTAFQTGGGVSLGLAYRVYETDYGVRPGAALETLPGNGYSTAYSMVPVRAPGTGLGPSYQLQLHYQYNVSTTFGLVLGRELETFTAGFDTPLAGARQFSFTGQHWLTPSWALSYDVLSSDPSSFRLQGLRLGARYRF